MVFVRLQGDDGMLVYHGDVAMFVAKAFLISHIVARSFNAARLLWIMPTTARSLLGANLPCFKGKSTFSQTNRGYSR